MKTVGLGGCDRAYPLRGAADAGRGAAQPRHLLQRNGRELHPVRHGSRPRAGPHNPNGSPAGQKTVTSAEGRCSLLMPRPQHMFRKLQMGWTDAGQAERCPWLRMFENARSCTGWIRSGAGAAIGRT
ncbi:MAG: phosphoribosylformylglycinamidine synthase subunit PurQ [Burkholderiales bacterium]|nr:phosphoribosylformylglycinamidine synthase subunit PurQ [Burkholderiales bacterium]